MSVVPVSQEIPNQRPSRKSDFKQQTMKAYKPVPTVKSAAIIFTILGIIFIIVGSVLLYYSLKIKEHKEQYDDKDGCKETKDGKSGECSVTLDVDEDMDGPVYFYYQLDNFYQNHRRYVKSKSSDQLKGNKISKSVAELDCDPIVYMEDLGFTADTLNEISKKYKLGEDWTEDEAESKSIIAYPCGKIAQTFFNDTFVMVDSNGKLVKIEEDDISWKSDRDNKFKQNSKKSIRKWMDVENEHFIVWMRTSGLPNFRKLWGRIEDGLNKGTYTVKITSNYGVKDFDGHKHVVISTANALGGDNRFLGIAYIVVGGITLILALAFVVRGFCFRKSDDLHRN